MVDFMKWALTDGQKFAADLGYSPLPDNVVDMELKALERRSSCSRWRSPGAEVAASDEIDLPRRDGCLRRRC